MTQLEFICTEEEISEAIRNKKPLYCLVKSFVFASNPGFLRLRWNVKEFYPRKKDLHGLFYKNYWHAYAEMRKRNGEN
jgi:hypothetical protein